MLAQPSPQWDEFVAAQPSASVYMLCGWSLLAREVFGHRAYFIEAREASGALIGVLPVVQQKSLLLGNFATSLPFFNYGGALCASDEIAAAMMAEGQALAARLGCSYIEFRDALPRPGNWIRRTDKVTLMLDLPPTPEKLAKQLGSKLRSQVKRADREQPSVRVGGVELADDFYEVFARNMRDLGTPVYPRKFFHAILQRFPQYCRILVVDRAGQPAAAGFIVSYNNRAEIPWAACRADAKPLGFNMKLYWEVLSFLVAQGCTSFDFGRSTADSGTYKFKLQWGARPQQLHWHRWERKASKEQAESTSQGGLMQYASSIWQRLPIGIANALGPLISPGLPW